MTKLSHIKTQWQFFRRYWRLAIHLTFKTQYFGVNNLWWAQQPSAIGWRCSERLWAILTVMPIVRNIQSLKVRSCLGWIPQSDCEALGFAEEIRQKTKR
jgi:hypothetical protein